MHSPSVNSRDQGPITTGPGALFVRNQFCTTIPLPTKQMYPDVVGRVAIVTGANSGIGLEACRQLVSLGLSHLIMAVRSLEKGHAAAQQVKLSVPSGHATKIEVWQVDMESYESIQAFARRCSSELGRLDMAILNAGLAHQKFSTLATTGHEPTVQVNHISTSLLAILLLPVLRDKSPANTPGRLAITSSLTAHLADFALRDKRPLLEAFDQPDNWLGDRYAQSKLLNQLFVARLSTLVDADKVTITLVEPGLVKGTGLFREMPGGALLKGVMHVVGRPVNQGAATYLDAVLAHGKEAHGSYVMNCKLAPYCHWYYDDKDGTRYKNAIWEETLKVLEFAGVEQVIRSME
ncbi:retinol dehydrogenase 12 [Microdochium trichocladiopsis]|uniref:Retinol dehydrogenase 12 n=1 Tax=Microdochium trichocladiopsis TaxID=1682393 RepID=A0A9P9BLK0_9PEZI|nr:retinol dehydrogenase 12 [Microdochium trichocladiopsis]KAH7024969.1 retinol dehydrogenase 12 [Microdochium trichocladiopsis]